MTISAPTGPNDTGLDAPGPPGAGRVRRGLAGTWPLARLAFRRDRIGLPAGVYVITVAVTGTAYAFKKLYPTASGRAALAAAGGGNPALRFLYGRLDGDSLGSLTTWRYGIWAGIFAALMTIFLVIRHTRSDEEAGRLELVGSAAVGRQAALVAGLLTAVTGVLTVAVLLCLTLPLAWIQLAQPFTGQRWWVLCLPLAVAMLGTGLAFALAARRDLGAGLLPDRPGRPAASVFLRGPFGLAWRLQRGVLLGWAIGYAVTFAASGAAAKGIGQLFGTSTALEREFSRLGSSGVITNAYLAALMLLAGLVSAAYAVSAVLRLRTEETEGRAEPVLATATGRVRWALSHIVIAVAGAALLLAVAGVATGLGYGLRTGSAGHQVARMTGAALGQLPSALVLAAVAILLFGLLPEAAGPGSWTAVGLVVAIALFGQVPRLSHWVLDISPFTHAPRLPGGPLAAAPLLWLGLAALALAVGGLAGLRRRDIG